MALRKGIRCSFQTVRNGGLKVANFTSQVFLRQKVNHVSCQAAVEQFLDSYDTFLFDCDGVLWENDHITPLPRISEAIGKLQRMDKNLIYVTNNSNVSRSSLRQKFLEHGFESSLHNIFGNAYAAAVYLKDIAKIQGKVYLIGSEGMRWELNRIGLENFGLGRDLDTPTSDIRELLSVKLEDDVTAVLVGFDPHLNFMKAFKASSYLCNEACHFVATNNIETSIYIGDKMDRRMPMTGMIVNAIADSSQRKPLVVGKPHKLMFQCLMKKHPNINKSRTIFVGDSLQADMGFAKTVGIDSAMVLTGTGTLEQISKMPHLAPDYVLNSLADICDYY